MEQQDMNILIIWRDKEIGLKVEPTTNLKELGQMLQELTNVKPDTMRLFVPNSKSKGVKMLSPFSDVYSGLTLNDTGFSEGKTVKMMGVSNNEIEEVSENGKRQDTRILGFDEEEKRLKQRASHKPQASLKLPQGQYIFCEFQPLHIPGIVLNPPPSEALRRMHMLACDPGIIAIMNKHRWRVGIMTEMAPEGYVGISPKCILGFNKNHGEEISLRLRTDDLKGFRKYDSIKKTLLHELAHMVYSEHDSKFFALNKQLNEEADNLDWTKSRGHTLGGHRSSGHYEEDAYIEESSIVSGQRLGGRSDPFANPRASSVAAAYNRLIDASTNSLSGSQGEAQHSILKDSEATRGQEHRSTEPDHLHSVTLSSDVVHMDVEIDNEPLHEFPMLERRDEPDPDASVEDKRISEPDPDDSKSLRAPLQYNGLKSDSLLIDEAMESVAELDAAATRSNDVSLKNQNIAEPDPDESLNKATNDFEMKDLHLVKPCGEPDPDESTKDMVLEASKQLMITNEELPHAPNSNIEPPLGDHNNDFLDNPELQRIEEPTAIICSRLQKTIDMLRSEVAPSQAFTALQTLFRIIRNVIEHPDEAKFRKLRKANPQFQRNVANFKAAMDVLAMVGFSEDVVLDEVGRAESFLVLKRNDPGLLWLVKSSLEVSIAYVEQSV